MRSDEPRPDPAFLSLVLGMIAYARDFAALLANAAPPANAGGRSAEGDSVYAILGAVALQQRWMAIVTELFADTVSAKPKQAAPVWTALRGFLR